MPLENPGVQPKQAARALAIDLLWITLSALLTALTVNLFFMHSDLAPGGLTGLSIILSLVSGIPLQYMSLVVSVPLLLLGMVFIGSKFGLKTLYITLTIPLFIALVPKLNPLAALPPLVQMALSMLAGGLMIGLSIGIALNHDCTTGGTDLLAMLIRKLLGFGEIPVIVFICDGIIILLSGFVARNVMVSVFSFLTLGIIIVTIKATVGLSAKKRAKEAEALTPKAQVEDLIKKF